MAPIPQEHDSIQPDLDARNDDERIVISGMSGLYPHSNNVKELSDILYNKVNPITLEGLRYNFNHPEVPKYGGTVPQLECFDAQFFKVHYRLGNCMDSMSRKILEQTYQAIYDAGVTVQKMVDRNSALVSLFLYKPQPVKIIFADRSVATAYMKLSNYTSLVVGVNPEQLNGKKVGVYIGTCFSETEKTFYYYGATLTGAGIAGCNKAMFANRISYWLNAKGPSMSIDEACCSSTAALEQAYLAMHRGECDAAVVGGAYLCLHPHSSVHYTRIMKLSADGKTKSFDQNADGCVKSEAINVLFLQKAKSAKRIYAEVLHVKTEFIGLLENNTGPKYGFYRNPRSMVNFMKNFYMEANVSPNAVEYVEALGCAVPVVDKAELEAIGEVFCNERDQPLLIGSVMSNIGYSEAASGICAVTKVLLGYHRGELAANLHCASPRRDVAALREGRMRVLTDHQRFGRSYAAVNGMSVTGVNAHVLLHGHQKQRDPSSYKSSIPHLLTISARMESSVNNILSNFKTRPINAEELALLHNIHQTNVAGHLGRGFTILHTNDNQETVSLCEKAAYFDVARRPLWFVYSGMGSQWAGMGAHLMHITIFAAAIERCRQVLEPKGIDIVHIITSPDKTIFDNILNSFVGIAAVQIGLTDVLRELGLEPDGIIGHSVGELGCAYADGCLTAEEMILAAYSRGLVSLQTPFIRGSMAAVGLGYQQILQMCPPEIEVACHNGPESSTISGPAEAMSQFVAQLTAKGIFAKEVPCSNIAYHSRYIADAGPGLLKYLTEVITPRLRTKRWVSSSVPQDRWDEALAQFSSAEYHTNNLLNPVLFEETSRLIPSNAVLVEVAPHGLLQAILKRSLSPGCTNIALTRRAHPDNAILLLEAIGKLYMEGFNPKVHVLYPKVDFPVSAGTPHLSHLVEWAHGEVWAIPFFNIATKRVASCCNFIISLHDQEHAFLTGNIIKGQTLYPWAAALVAVWDTLAMTVGAAKKQLSAELHDVQLHVQPTLHDQRQLRLSVSLHRGSGRFEILHETAIVATGIINLANIKQDIVLTENVPEQSSDDTELSADDVYNLFEDRDYSYRNEFRAIVSASSSLCEARLQWRDNWVTLIDGMLQLNALQQSHDGVSTPAYIRKICINVEKHSKHVVTADNNVYIKAEILKKEDLTRCGGITIENIKYYNLPAVPENKMALNIKKFVPYMQDSMKITTSIQIFLQIVAENKCKNNLRIIQIANENVSDSIFEEIKKALDNQPQYNILYKEVTKETISKDAGQLKDVDLLFVTNLAVNNNLCCLIDRAEVRDVFIIRVEENIENNANLPTSYHLVSSHNINGKCKLDLALLNPAHDEVTTIAVTVLREADFEILKSTRASLLPKHKLLVVSPYPAVPGLKELISSWRQDIYRNRISLLMVNDAKYYNSTTRKLPNVDLVFNVIENNVMGGEYYVPLDEKPSKKNGVTLKISEIGNLDSLMWVAAPAVPSGYGIPVFVQYAGFNYNDVRKVNGEQLFKQDIDNSYGMDFSGITKNGERVMGLVASGSCSSVVRAVPELLWPVPAHWTLEDAATVPLAYTLAFYCFFVKAQLLPGMSVLIQGGAGALGQAAISIALALKCQVFTTVSDKCKKQFLKKMFPELKDDHIGNSRDETFGDTVLNATKGKGCQFVIATGSGYLKNNLIKCGSTFGIIFDITLLKSHEKYEFGMNSLNGLKSYYSIDLSSIFTEKNYEDLKTLQVVMSENLAKGLVRPLTRITFPSSESSRAVRLLAASRHRGRVLLKLSDAPLTIQPRLACDPNQWQLVQWDDKCLGLQLADRLVSRGARKLHLHTKMQITSYLTMKIRERRVVWESCGVQVKVSSTKLKSEKDILSLLEYTELGTVEGVYVILGKKKDRDEALITALNLAIQKLCSNIKYFIVINRSHTIQHHTFTPAPNQVPTTILTILDSEDAVSGVPEQPGWWRAAVNAAERALCCAGAGAHLLALPAPRAHTLLQQIARLTGMCLEDKGLNTILEELNIDEYKLKILSNYLRVHHNISLSEKELQSLTIEEIQQLDGVEIKTETRKGLENFFLYVDSDELMATTEIVFLPTLAKSVSMRDEEFDASQTHLCIVPGLEGHHARFRVLCERLKLPALVLQPGLDCPRDTPTQLAHKYVQILLTKVGVKDNFYLLGYENGVVVALEIASILEERGMTGTVFCVGHMPDEWHAALGKLLGQYETAEQLQDAVVRHMYTLMVGADAGRLESELRAAATWPQKLDAAVRSSLGRVPHSAQYARALIETALARVVQATRHTHVPRALRSKLVLLRAATARPPPDARALQQHSEQPVAVHQLRASLAHAAADMRCAALINGYLHPRIIQEYQQMNTCETYLLNANCYMTPYKKSG